MSKAVDVYKDGQVLLQLDKITHLKGFPRWLKWLKKKSSCQCRSGGFDPWVGKIPWSKKWQPTPVFLPGKFHGQRSLADCSPWDHGESDMMEHTHISDIGADLSELIKV